MYKYSLLLILFLSPTTGWSKKIESLKPEPAPTSYIQSDIDNLCSAKMAGRLVGTEGEQAAADYLQQRFIDIGIPPYNNKYIWDFTFKSGLRLGNNSYFKIFENKLVTGTDVIFLPYAKENVMKGFALPKVYEPDNVWLVPISTLMTKVSNNAQKIFYDHAVQCIAQHASGVVFLNDNDVTHDLSPTDLTSFEQLSVPVAFITSKAYLEYIKPNLKMDWISVDAKLGYENANTTGRNVIASIDNKSPFSIVIAAHYDHLGDMSGLCKGADYNASGVAALLAIAEMVKTYKLKRFNYIFIALSGKEADMQGSKSFVMQNEFVLNNISCMIDLNMVGRLNAARDVYVSGTGTTADWNVILQKMNKGFMLHTDTSGISYTDANTFYNKNIPVLTISTGFHDDYMRVSDDETKINYSGILEIASYTYRMLSEMDKQTKMIFNKTVDILPLFSKLRSDLGLLHDLSFNQNGMRVATTLPGSKGAAAGIKSGDVITKIGLFNIIDHEDFIEAMTKTEPGKETIILVKRGNNEFKFFVVL